MPVRAGVETTGTKVDRREYQTMYIPDIFEPNVDDWRTSYLGGAYLPDEALYFFHCVRTLCHISESATIKLDHISVAVLSEMVGLGTDDETKYADKIRAIIAGKPPTNRRWVSNMYIDLCEDQDVDPEYNMYLIKGLMEGCITRAMAEIHLDLMREIREFQDDNKAEYREPVKYSSTIVMVYKVDIWNIAVHEDQVSKKDIKKLSNDFGIGLRVIPNVASDEGILSEDTKFHIMRPVTVESLYPLMGLVEA